VTDPQEGLPGTEETKLSEIRIELLCGLMVVACVVAYRPITFWADNAWDLSVPLDLFGTALIQLALALPILALIVLLRTPIFSTALLVGSAFFTVFNWGSLSTIGFLVIGAIVVSVYAVTVFGNAPPTRVTAVIATLCVVGPLVVLGNAHIGNRASYPFQSSTSDPTAEASGLVQDILLLVVDGYPMVSTAEQFYGHDLDPLLEVLEDHDYQTPRVSWSHNTFTSLAIPSMVELIQVVEPTGIDEWQNQKDNYGSARGSNFTVEALRSAGFRYTHIESGWNGDECGSPDSCLETSWMDEANWQLLKPAVFNQWLGATMGSHSVSNSVTTVEHLLETDVFENEGRDFVYAHILLPHPPEVVDADCQVVRPSARGSGVTGVSAQFECVDSMIASIVSAIPPETAVVIAGDHGPAKRGQNFREPSQWDDADIAERLGALLSYRLPPGCTAQPGFPSNLSAMRSIMSCAITAELPTEDQGFVLGMDRPVEVTVERLQAIEDSLNLGTLDFDS
jgi:hypothetical protein